MNRTNVYKKWAQLIILELGLSELKLDILHHLAIIYLFISPTTMHILNKQITTRTQKQNRREPKKDLVNFVFLYN